MSRQIIIDYWIEKAGEDLASARDNLKSGRYQMREISLKNIKKFVQCSTGTSFKPRK